MKKTINLFLFIVTGFLISTHAHAKTASEVFDAVSPSIVVIMTCDSNGKKLGLASGVIIPGGSVATNFHVVKDAKIIKVLYEKKEYPATLRYSDCDRDVCTLIVKSLNAPAVSMGATSRLKVGKRVFAIGAPQGLELTLSEGIISSLRLVDGGQYIQTTAAISAGSSGGGLFDEEGRLIGLTAFYLSKGQQLNFAVPVEWIDELPKRPKEISKSSLVPYTDWIDKALALERKKDWAELLNHSLRWTKSRPEDSFAWFCLGVAYDNSGQYSKAIEVFQQAIRIDPEDAAAWSNLGSVFVDSGQYSKAIEAFQQAIHAEPQYAKAWYNLGVTFADSGQYSKAIEVFQQAVRIEPESTRAWRNLGLAFGKSGQYSKAIEAFQQAIHAEPQYAKAWYNLGANYKRLNQSAKVMDVYKRLKVLDPVLADDFLEKIVRP